MGFLDSLGSVLDRVGGAAQGFLMSGGNPLGAVQGLAGVERAKKQDKILESNMSIYSGFNEGQMSSQLPVPMPAPRDSFFGNLGQTIGNFGSEVGQFFQDIRPATDLLGIRSVGPVGAPPAAQTIIKQAPDETAMSGEILGANLGMGGALLQGARNFARSPAGQGLIGGGVGVGGALVVQGGNGMPRVTRRMKSDVRRIYNMAGMNANATAQILNNLGTYPRMNFDAALVFFILTKRFRNDGPVVTKAAVRKTKTTLRRMKGVVDMYNSVCKPAARRAPARRTRTSTATTLIKN